MLKPSPAYLAFLYRNTLIKETEFWQDVVDFFAIHVYNNIHVYYYSTFIVCPTTTPRLLYVIHM